MKWQAWCVSLVGTLVATWIVGSPSFGDGGAIAGSLKVQSDDHAVTITNKQQLVLQYQFNPVPFKPCIQQFLSPAGVNILRDAPPDHAHHHALMFAIAADGVNFWEEVAPAGRQVHRSFVSHGGKASFFSSMVFVTEQLDWVGPENQTILQE
ncbi:MAG TPA: DUF6807 family protein, partial [Tepidisphaeraceae bacterium]|nr:DUF6807 family protein [Tepidisphaeraceae bacterium]